MIMLQENQLQQNILMMAIFAVRQRREEQENRAPRARRWWVKPWVGRRRVHGQYYNLFQELDRETRLDYHGYVRMSRNDFHDILERIAPRITKCGRYGK